MYREFVLIIVLLVLAGGSIYGNSISAALHLVRRLAHPHEIIERDRLSREASAKTAPGGGGVRI